MTTLGRPTTKDGRTLGQLVHQHRLKADKTLAQTAEHIGRTVESLSAAEFDYGDPLTWVEVAHLTHFLSIPIQLIYQISGLDELATIPAVRLIANRVLQGARAFEPGTGPRPIALQAIALALVSCAQQSGVSLAGAQALVVTAWAEAQAWRESESGT